MKFESIWILKEFELFEINLDLVINLSIGFWIIWFGINLDLDKNLDFV